MAAPISYITKRLLVEGEKNLKQLSDEGFMGVWRTLTEMAKKPTEADSFIKLNVKSQAKATDFKGIFGFFNKFAESAKVLWNKWTGHLSQLIENVKSLAKRKAEREAVRSVKEVLPPKEILENIKNSLSPQARQTLSQDVYKILKETKSENLPKDFVAMGLNILKNNGPDAMALTDSQVHLLLKNYNKLPKEGALASLKDSLAAVIKKSGIQSRVLPLGQPVKELFDQKLAEEITRVGKTNIKALSKAVNEPAMAFVNKEGRVLFKPKVSVPRHVSAQGVSLTSEQDRRLLALYLASKNKDLGTIQGYAKTLVNHMKQKPDEFLKDYLAMAKGPGSHGEALNLGLLPNKPSGRVIAENAKEIIQKLNPNDASEMGKLAQGLVSLLEDPMLLSKMPKTLQATL